MSAWLPTLAKLGGLPCAGGKFKHCGLDPDECVKRKRKFLDVDWPTCPVRAVLDDPTVALVIDLEQRLTIAPPSNEPAAWVWEAVSTLRTERERARDQNDRVEEM